MEKRIFTVEDRSDLERCFPIMQELRPHLSFEEYIAIYNDSHAVGAGGSGYIEITEYYQ